MVTRTFLAHIMLVLVAMAFQENGSLVLAQQQRQRSLDQSTVPGEGDIAIMQKEIKWGMQEMQRYKSIRGAWPVRSHEDDADGGESNNSGGLSSTSTKQLEVAARNSRRKEDDNNNKQRTVRGGAKPGEEMSAHNSYWDLLVSVF